MNTTHPTLSEALTEIQTLSTLADLLGATGIARHLSQQPTFTLLAPANQAFATLPPGMVDEWSCPDNQYQLSSIMRHHILPFRWLISSPTQPCEPGRLCTWEGNSLDISIIDEMVRIDQSLVILPDLLIRNGVIHIVNEVLLPYH